MSDRIIVLTKRPATVKCIHDIDFEMDNRTPLNCRESPKFSKYFNLLWKELNDEKSDIKEVSTSRRKYLKDVRLKK